MFIEPAPERDLHRSERQKIRSSEKAQACGIERELAIQLRRDDGIDRAQAIRQKIAQREGHEHAQKEVGVQRAGFYKM
jgi:hypothetical protein